MSEISLISITNFILIAMLIAGAIRLEFKLKEIECQNKSILDLFRFMNDFINTRTRKDDKSEKNESG